MENTKLENAKIKKVNIHKNHRQRLREELLLNGFNTSEHRVLEYILFDCHTQKDMNPLAHKLIDKFGSFKNVLEASYSDLIKVDGVGDITAKHLTSIIPIFNYYNHQKLNCIKTKIQTKKDYVNYFKTKINDLSQESLLVIALSSNFEVKSSKIITTGTDTQVKLNPMEILSFLNENKTNKTILMHNHPSGDPTPSFSDIENTKEILKTFNLIGIELIDHIIVANSGYYSFNEQNKIEEFISELQKSPYFKKKD
ncbi:MAG: hypothetical protein E7359_03120 [Clostridiales bacterium]|nr:hypothetical protein [Clostridiales bacterium]